MRSNGPSDLKDRRNRFGHYKNDDFPFHLYPSSKEAWYYLRLPTSEEQVNSSWTIGAALPALSSYAPTFPPPYLDLWNVPYPFAADLGVDTKSGSLNTFVESPRHIRAGEDIILKNVLSFDVKVWNPYWVPCDGAYAPPQYVDLGQDQFNSGGTVYYVDYTKIGTFPSQAGPPSYTLNALPYSGHHPYDGGGTTPPSGAPVGFGFTTKGHYGGVSAAGGGKFVKTVNYTVTYNYAAGSIVPNVATTGQAMPCVFDSWTKNYEMNPDVATETQKVPTWTGTPRRGTGIHNPENGGNPSTNANEWECPPPYEEDLKSIQITIRCFDPDSKNIRQVRVVHHFP
jgi:hypothetical protein